MWKWWRVCLLIACLALTTLPVVAQQPNNTIPALAPWDGGSRRLAYCTGPGAIQAQPQDGGTLLLWCTDAPVSPLATPTPTENPYPTDTPIPTEWATATWTPTLTPTVALPTVTPTPTATEGMTMTTFNGQVAASADDALQSGSTVNITGLNIRINGTTIWGGWRFQNVTVPQGATISDAYLEFFVTSLDDPNLVIYGEAADDAAAFAASSNDISGRGRTTANYTWNQANVGALAFRSTGTGSLTSVVQEIVNRAGWASGNDMAFVLNGATGGDVQIRAYDNVTTDAAKLTIVYTAGGATYTLGADAGSYAITGAAATLQAARRLAADAGSYTLTGQAATLRAARLLAADAGSYTLTGQAATLLVSRLLAADTGSYSVTGLDATLTYTPSGATYTLAADAGSYTLTGAAATLLVSRVLSVDAGVYVLTGQAAALIHQYVLQADAGSYSVTGNAATLLAARILAANPGAYTLTGQPVTFLYSGAAANVPEERTLSVGGVQRVYVVDGEERTYVIVAGNRTYTVD